MLYNIAVTPEICPKDGDLEYYISNKVKKVLTHFSKTRVKAF